MNRILTIILLAIAMAGYAQNTMTGSKGIGKIPYFTCPSMGEMHFPVIIVTYTDVGLSASDENVMHHFDDFFNKEGYNWGGATGSVRDYFITASAGRFSPHFDVLGVVPLNNKRSYYGEGLNTNSGHPEEMVIEGVTGLQGRHDFSKYDSNGDKYVDNVIVVFAGNAQRFGAPDSAVLPTSYLISYNKYGESDYQQGYEQDGMHFDSYTVISELAYNKYDGLGTFVHEFSHALGLADAYNLYDTNADYTPMYYDLMDIGMYNNERRTPPTYSAFERFALGWIDLEVIESSTNIELDPLDTSNQGYIIPITSNEFFIIENRQKQGWDTYMPGHGLMIWHIDYDRDEWYNNIVNYVKSHQRIQLIRPTTPVLTLKPWTNDGTERRIMLTGEKNGHITTRVTSSAGITDPQTDDEAGCLYDLSGRHTDANTSGFYIVRYASGKANKISIKAE